MDGQESYPIFQLKEIHENSDQNLTRKTRQHQKNRR